MRTLILAVALLAAPACKKDDKAPPAEKVKPAPKAETPAAQAGKTAPLESVVHGYARLHAYLAGDRVDGVGEVAAEIVTRAEAARAGAPEAAKPHLDGIIATAPRVGAATDLEGARKAFGELSRHVVALVEADPALRSAVKIYECPMVEGEGAYKRWAQLGGDLQNPYFGSKMLTCGTEVK